MRAMARAMDYRTEAHLEALLQIASTIDGVKVTIMRSGSLEHRATRARHLYFWLALNTYGNPALREIGAVVRKGHQIVLYGDAANVERMQREREFCQRVQMAKDTIMAHGAVAAVPLVEAREELRHMEETIVFYNSENTRSRALSYKDQNAKFVEHWRATVGEARWP